MGLYDEAIARQIEAIKLSKTSNEKHKSYYNLGNLYMKKDMCSEAVNAYKNALRNDPKDEQTRYNLSIAKLCEENQNNEQDNDQQQDEEQDNNDKQEQQDEQNGNNDQQQDEQQSESVISKINKTIKAMRTQKARIKIKSLIQSFQVSR